VPFFAVLHFCSGTAHAFPWLGQTFLPVNVLRPALFLAALWVLAGTRPQFNASVAMMVQWACFVAVTLLALLALLWRIEREAPAPARSYETRRWLRAAGPLLGVALFGAYLPEITVVISGFWLDSREIGVLQASYRIALLISFGLYAVDAFTAPEAARHVAREDRAELQKTVDRATRLRFWPALAAAILLALAGRPILALFGPEFVAGYAALVILALAQLAQAAVGPVTRLMMLTGHQDRALLASLGALLLLLPLLAVLAPRYGATGVAVAAFIDLAVWSWWMRWLVVRSLDVRPSIF
jgi:O-antigen/teichoic acid export membrane protein